MTSDTTPDSRPSTPIPGTTHGSAASSGTPPAAGTAARVRIEARQVSVYYGETQALHEVSMRFPEQSVTALIGPSGCGKSTFLRCFNRMNDTIAGCQITGAIMMDGRDINSPEQDVVSLRTHVGMVFQTPNPFPKTIYDNIAYGPKLHGLYSGKAELDQIVARSLKRVGLWSEVKDRLETHALGLSGGQQQRLCIARSLAVHPEVILMDEPCSALDPIATSRVEELIAELKSEYVIIIVTHSMQQARRVSDYTGFFHLGHVVEYGETASLFEDPKEQRTRDYIAGRYG